MNLWLSFLEAINLLTGTLGKFFDGSCRVGYGEKNTLVSGHGHHFLSLPVGQYPSRGP